MGGGTKWPPRCLYTLNVMAFYTFTPNFSLFQVWFCKIEITKLEHVHWCDLILSNLMPEQAPENKVRPIGAT